MLFALKSLCRNRVIATALAMLILNLIPGFVQAHAVGWSYVFITVEETGVTGRLELPIDQLDRVLGLDKDGNGEVSDDEVEAAWDAIERYAADIVEFGTTDLSYSMTFTGRDRLDVKIANYAVLRFSLQTPLPVPHLLAADFQPFFSITREHRGGLVLENNYLTGVKDNESVISLIFSPQNLNDEVDLRGESIWTLGSRFIVEGAWHIWIGIDHVLFLVALLLTAVMTRKDSQWHHVPEFRTAFINLISIITLFTIAHSVTLALALKGWVSLPSRFVESVIALSVLVVASNNIRPWLRGRNWWLVFGFGLFHGLGFANVLILLVVGWESKLVSLIGFNLGVEVGQLAIVTVLFPVLYWSRNKDWYRKFVLPGVSGAIALIALWWFVTRALGIESPFTSF